LDKSVLLDVVLNGLRDGGWVPLLLDDEHPFLIRATNADRQWLELRVFIWTCTHGGKGRAGDEFRIQFTGQHMPQRQHGAITLLLGWHPETEVLAAWDIDAHDGQASSSPSAQLKEATLQKARETTFATQVKGNEVVVAFKPVFLADYAAYRDELHKHDSAAMLDMLNHVDQVTERDIDRIRSPFRRILVRTIVTRYRASDFRDRVLNAYGHKCAFCGLQLGLLDAAHVMPVAAPGSTDEIENGVAACKLHHYAYDSNLISFTTSYRIEVSQERLAELEAKNWQGGLLDFRSNLNNTLLLPGRAQHHPNPRYIEESRRFRDWRP
jgi:putative restriction endonuclease